MTKPAAILSMLHEPRGAGSARRLFRDEPVLRWTLRRLGRAGRVDGATVLCWEDQADDVRRAIDGAAGVAVRGGRQGSHLLDPISASRRWADGWRGGLLGTCEFDRGFHGIWMHEICRERNAEAVVLVDPAAGLVDPILIDGLVEHSHDLPDVDLFFSQAAPGLSGVMLRGSLLGKFAMGKTHPGALLSYRPDFARHDPIADPACVPIPIPLARTQWRFSLDSQRQCNRLSVATAHLNGELIGAGAMDLLGALEAAGVEELLPRELVMELNTERATEAIFRAGKRLAIERPAMELGTAKRLIAELAESDDARLVLAGVGDPLLHEGVMEIIGAASAAGIRAIAIETDFAAVPGERIEALANSEVDIVSVHLPAATPATYRAMMGTDALASVMANLRAFADTRLARGAGVPLLVPTFVKCKQNIGEMEAWYDHWLRAVNCAVVTGPSDYGGLIPDVATADMSGPRRRACGSLSKRLMVLSDGRIVSCEQDILGRQVMGGTIKEAWRRAGELLRDHTQEQWNQHPACAGCKEWNR